MRRRLGIVAVALAAMALGVPLGALQVSPGSTREVATAAWVALYSGPTGSMGQTAKALALDPAGNVYVAGWSRDGDASVWLTTVKYNTDGVQQWVNRHYVYYMGWVMNTPIGLAVDAQGNAYVSGVVWELGVGLGYLTIKYSTDGVQQWEARRSSACGSPEEPKALAVDGMGNVYVTGESHVADCRAFEWGYATVKYNANGAQQWVARYDVADGTPAALAVDQGGNVYVTGSEATVKYDASGAQQWVLQTEGYDLALDAAGNVYIIRASADADDPTGDWGTDYETTKYNTDGVQQWVSHYDGLIGQANDESPVALAVDQGGNVYVTGASEQYESRVYPNNGDYATVKYDADGVQQWVARYDTGVDEQPSALALDGAGNVYVGPATVKYNANGVQQWVSPRKVSAVALAVDAAGNVYVTGTSYDNFATVKYVQVESLPITKVGPEIVPAAVGASVPYSITVQNNSSSVARNVEVYDFPPKALRFVNGSWSKSDPPDSGTCFGGDDLVTCWVGDVASRGTVTVALATTLRYEPVEPAVSNMACASAWNTYPSCTQTTAGVGAALVAADLRMRSVAGPDSVDRILNNNVNYDVVVTNDGPGAADGAIIRTKLDANLRPGASTWQNSSGSSGGCTASGRVVECSVGTLSAGGSATAHVRTTLANTAAPFLHSQACVGPPDTNLQNNCRDWRTSFSSSNRKVVFIQGINSGSACPNGFEGRVQWIEDYLTGQDPAGSWVARYVQLFPRNLPSSLGDFRYFSYSGNNGCRGEMAEYGPTDTCNGIADAAGKLDSLIQRLIAQDPNVNLDLVAHSMGGPVAATWVVDHPDTARKHVNSVVTFDSPLKGLPKLNAIFLGTALWGWNKGSACNATDPSVVDLYSESAPRQSSWVTKWQKAGGIVPFYTVDGGRSEMYLGGLLEAVPGWPPGWPNDRTSMAGQRDHIRVDAGHTGVWEGEVDRPLLKLLVACAVTGAPICTPVQEDLTAVQTGEVHRVEAWVSPEDVTLAVGTLWGEGTVETTLEAPDGTVIDSATQDPNVRHGADAGYQIYEVDHPQPGVWYIVVKAVDMPAGGGTVSVRADMVGVAPPDEDEDGIPDGEDNCQIDNNADQSDVDADGLGDACDPDIDNDGVLNALDDCSYVTNPDQADLDGDGLGDACDGDNDNDHMPDAEEAIHTCLSTSVDDSAGDPDADGLASLEEIWLGTDPCQADTDSDVMPDSYEVANTCLDPITPDAASDPDGDGLDNLTEYGLAWDPCVSGAAVGGIAEYPQLQSEAAVSVHDSTGTSTFALAGLAAGAALLLAAGGWYARRRWLD